VASAGNLQRITLRTKLAIRFGVILRKVWGGSRNWAGARAQAVLRSVWRTCRPQGRCALDFLSQRLRGTPVALALPPLPAACELTRSEGLFCHRPAADTMR
jgi:transposase